MAHLIDSSSTEYRRTLRKGMSRRSFLRITLAGSGLLTGAAAAEALSAQTAFADSADAATVGADDYPEQLKIAHLTDIHYFSKDLWSDCADFTVAENSDRKMFKESGAILDKALADLVDYKPDLIVVSGDLTKDGERVCHEQVHAKLIATKAKIAAANGGKEPQILVINGNHDINNHANGRDFSSGAAQPTDELDPLQFKKLYHDCGYDAAFATFDKGGTMGGSLSYAVRPAKGVTMLVIDSGKYSADQTASGTDEHETSGMIGEKLLAWTCSQAKQAKKAGDVVIAMQHHGIVPHFGMEPQVLGEYLVDDYERIAAAYADAGISCVLTGHMHANDIAATTTASGSTIYDIETCATVTYPSNTRYATLSWTRKGDTATVDAVLDVENHELGAVAYGDSGYPGAANISDITAYGNDHLLTTDVVKTMVGDALVAPYLQQFASMGSKAAIAGLMGVGPEQLDERIFSLVAGLLPTSKETGMVIDWSTLHSLLKSYGSAAIWFDGTAAKIMIERVEDNAAKSNAVVPMSLELTSADAAKLKNAEAAAPRTSASTYSLYISTETLSKFLSKVYRNLDEKVLTDPDAVVAIVKQLVDVLMAAKVADGEHAVFDLVKYAYGDHLHGDETCDAWAETAIANSAKDGSTAGDGSVIGFARAAVNSVVVGDGSGDTDLITLLKKVRFTIGDLVAANDGGSNKGPFTLIGFVVNSVGALLQKLGDDPAALIPNIPSLTQLLHDTLYTLTHDDNVQTDRKLALPAVALTDPDYKPGDNGGNGGSTGEDGNGSQGGSGDQGDHGSNPGSGAGNGGSSANGSGSGNGTGAGDSGSKTPTGGGSKGSKGNLPQTGDSSLLATAATALTGIATVAVGIRKALRPEPEGADEDIERKF